MNKRITIHPFFWAIGFLLVFGLLMIGDVSLLEAERNYGDQLYLIKKHALFLLVGLLVFWVVSKINYLFWKKIALPLYFFSLLPLILVLVPSIGQLVWGARRWLVIGPLTFQPSELAKLSLVLLLAALGSEKKINLKMFSLLTLFPAILTILEPDFGTMAIIVASAFMVLVISGTQLRHILVIALAGVVLGCVLILSSPYRRNRVAGLIDPFYDPQGKSYHSYQMVLTLGSGGITGVGIGQSRQKYQYLPQVSTDSIMAIVGEELGLIGLTAVIIIFILAIWQGLRIASSRSDQFSKLFTVGIVGWFAFQGLVNLSSVAVVLPLTGIPFPLVSYGGTSLLIFMLSLGILFNISQHRQWRLRTRKK